MTSVINKHWSQVEPPMPRSRPLFINVHVNIQSTIQSTRAGLERCHLAFAVANCLLNWRFARAAVGSCGDCWKLLWVAGKACNMTENARCILIVLFSVQLQQTEISGRKLFIFQHGRVQHRDSKPNLHIISPLQYRCSNSLQITALIYLFTNFCEDSFKHKFMWTMELTIVERQQTIVINYTYQNSKHENINSY